VNEQTTQPSEEALLKEYYEIFHAVDESDKRLLTVKGWGVTLSMAALAWGFQYAHYGLFLVAALSGLAFWLIEGVLKRHQMRHYLRMRDIEVLQYLRTDEGKKVFSSPRIDSTWSDADAYYRKRNKFRNSESSEPSDTPKHPPEITKSPLRSYMWAWAFPHICLPHVVSVVAGLALLLLGICGELGDMEW
jgi:hypothetical protein